MKALLATLAIPLAFAGAEGLAQVPEKKPMPSQTYVKKGNLKLNPAGEKGSRLSIYEVLKSGEYMVGPDRQSVAVLHTDGNFCFYRGDPNKAVERLWCSGVTGGEGAYHATVGADANFCVHRGPPTDRKGNLWCTNSSSTYGRRVDVYLEVESGRVAVISPEIPGGGMGNPGMPKTWNWTAP